MVKELASSYHFLHETVELLLFIKLVELDDVGMVQLAEHFYLVEEGIRVYELRLGYKLDGPELLGSLMLAIPYFSEASVAEALAYLIVVLDMASSIQTDEIRSLNIRFTYAPLLSGINVY